MNKCTIVGRLTKDVELVFAKGTGNAVSKFTVAVNRRFKKEGQPDADFIPVVVFGKTAEACANYTAKGKLVSVAGSIQTSTYTNKDGVKVYKTEVLADEVNFLEWLSKDGGNSNNSNTAQDDFNGEVTPMDNMEDIPF